MSRRDKSAAVAVVLDPPQISPYVKPELIHVNGDIELTRPMGEATLLNLLDLVVCDPEVAQNWIVSQGIIKGLWPATREDRLDLYQEWMQRVALVAAQRSQLSEADIQAALDGSSYLQDLVPVDYRSFTFRDPVLQGVHEMYAPLVVEAVLAGHLEAGGLSQRGGVLTEAEARANRSRRRDALLSLLLMAQKTAVIAVVFSPGIRRFFAQKRTGCWTTVYQYATNPNRSWAKEEVYFPDELVEEHRRTVLS